MSKKKCDCDIMGAFFTGMLIVAFLAIFVVALDQETHDKPTNSEWEEIGEMLCNLKYDQGFVDWEDGTLYCEKIRHDPNLTWDVIEE